MWVDKTYEYIPDEVAVFPLVRVRRERVLKAPGQVLVRIGQFVQPHDVVARAPGHMRVHVVDVAGELGIKPKVALKTILVEPGQTVKERDILARQKGVFRRREVSSPVSGRVILVDDRGRVLIQVAAEGETLRAGLQGKVINLMPRFGVVIESVGAFVQGVWGNGKSHVGVLRVLAAGPDATVAPDRLDVSVRGSIVVAGRTVDAALLEAASKARVHGIIVGSLRPELLELAQRQEYAVVVTDGLHGRGISAPIFDILQRCDGREVVVHAAFNPGRPRVRPEILVPLPGEEEAPLFRPGRPLQAGDVVRVVAPPLFGRIGVIRTPWAGKGVLESGLEVDGCEVALSDGSVHFVALHAVERLTGAETLHAPD